MRRAAKTSKSLTAAVGAIWSSENAAISRFAGRIRYRSAWPVQGSTQQCLLMALSSAGLPLLTANGAEALGIVGARKSHPRSGCRRGSGGDSQCAGPGTAAASPALRTEGHSRRGTSMTAPCPGGRPHCQTSLTRSKKKAAFRGGTRPWKSQKLHREVQPRQTGQKAIRNPIRYRSPSVSKNTGFVPPYEELKPPGALAFGGFRFSRLSTWVNSCRLLTPGIFSKA